MGDVAVASARSAEAETRYTVSMYSAIRVHMHLVRRRPARYNIVPPPSGFAAIAAITKLTSFFWWRSLGLIWNLRRS